jgi:hypothetical protein
MPLGTQHFCANRRDAGTVRKLAGHAQVSRRRRATTAEARPPSSRPPTSCTFRTTRVGPYLAAEKHVQRHLNSCGRWRRVGQPGSTFSAQLLSFAEELPALVGAFPPRERCAKPTREASATTAKLAEVTDSVGQVSPAKA